MSITCVCKDCPARMLEKAEPPDTRMILAGCWLEVWNDFPYRDQVDKPPFKCKHKRALKTVVEDSELVLVAVPKDADYVDAYGYVAEPEYKEALGRWLVKEK